MKKRLLIAFTSLCFVFLFASCGGQSYADKLDKEKKAINRFIDSHNVTVLNYWPGASNFGPNDYYKDGDTGAYIHVIDPGSGAAPQKKDKIHAGQRVMVRFSDINNMLDNSVVVGTNDADSTVNTVCWFAYGDEATYPGDAKSEDPLDKLRSRMMSKACILALDHGVHFNGKVSLIVPFEHGSNLQQTYYVPLYYASFKYLPFRPEDNDKSNNLLK